MDEVLKHSVSCSTMNYTVVPKFSCPMALCLVDAVVSLRFGVFPNDRLHIGVSRWSHYPLPRNVLSPRKAEELAWRAQVTGVGREDENPPRHWTSLEALRRDAHRVIYSRVTAV